jgi:hypothetical protein
MKPSCSARLSPEVWTVSADLVTATPRKDCTLLARNGTVGAVPTEKQDLLATGCPNEPPPWMVELTPRALRGTNRLLYFLLSEGGEPVLQRDGAA